MTMLARVLRGLSTGVATFLGLLFVWAVIEVLSGQAVPAGPPRVLTMFAVLPVALSVMLIEIGRGAPPAMRRTPPAAAPAAPAQDAADYAAILLAVAQTGMPRPPADVDTPTLQALRRAAGTCLALRHVFPPRFPPASLNALGGLPVAPSDFDYPVVLGEDGQPAGLSFMAQVDCATLPPGPARDLLPDSGHLYFFAPIFTGQDDQRMPHCVRYVPGPADAGWAPRRPPPHAPLRPLIDAEVTDRWTEWAAQPRDLLPRVSPRVEVELGWVAHKPAEPDGERGVMLNGEHERDSLIAFFGAPAPLNPALIGWANGAALPFPPYEGFPLNRRAAEILIGHLRVLLRDDQRNIQKQLAAAPPPDDATTTRLRQAAAERDAMAADLAGLAVAQPQAHEQAVPLTQAEREAVLDQLRRAQSLSPIFVVPPNASPDNVRAAYERRRRQKLEGFVARAAAESAETALRDPHTKGLVPADYVVDVLRYFHTPLKQDQFDQRGHYTLHQMLGAGRDVQGAADWYGQSHILLMQFSPDDGLQWRQGDVGVMQYWITPTDLAMRRFDNVEVTFESN